MADKAQIGVDLGELKEAVELLREMQRIRREWESQPSSDDYSKVAAHSGEATFAGNRSAVKVSGAGGMPITTAAAAAAPSTVHPSQLSSAAAGDHRPAITPTDYAAWDPVTRRAVPLVHETATGTMFRPDTGQAMTPTALHAAGMVAPVSPAGAAVLSGGQNIPASAAAAMRANYGVPGVVPPTPKPMGIRELGEMMGGMEAWRMMQTTATFAGQEYGRSVTEGTPFHAISMRPSMIRMAGLAGGAAIGTYFGSPLIGAGIGTAVAEPLAAYDEEITKHHIQLERLNYIGKKLGYGEIENMPEPYMKMLETQWMKGRNVDPVALEHDLKKGPTTRGFLAKAYKWMGTMPVHGLPIPGLDDFIDSQFERGFKMLPGIFGEVDEDKAKTWSEVDAANVDRLINLGGSKKAMRVFGKTIDNINLKTSAGMKQARQLAATMLEDDPSSVASLLGPDFADLRTTARQRMVQQAMEEGLSMALQAEGMRSTFFIGKAAKYGGVDDMQRAVAGGRAVLQEQRGLLQEKLSRVTKETPGDVATRRMLTAQIDLLAGQEDMLKEYTISKQSAILQANADLTAGRGDRAFRREELSGRSVYELPWDQRAGGYRAKASALRSEMSIRRAAGMLSPEMEASMTGAAEDAEFTADVELPAQRTQMWVQERLGRASLEGVAGSDKRLSKALRGSFTDQVETITIQMDALDKKKQALEDILKLQQGITASQRLEYQAQLEGIKADHERLKVQKELAGVQAAISEFQVTSGTRREKLRQAELQGPSFAGWRELQLQGHAEGLAEISMLDSQIKALKDKGWSDDSPEVQRLRLQRTQSETRLQEFKNSSAVPPMPAAERAKASELEAVRSIYSAGYGSYGDVRDAIKGQMQLTMNQLGRMEQTRNERKKAGDWNDQNESDYWQSKSGLIQQAAQLQEEYSYGWDQRLISEAINMPSHGRLMMSRFTRREAALYGIAHRAFGGTEEQTRHMRENGGILGLLRGSGNPQAFGEDAMAKGVGMPKPTVIRIELVNNSGMRAKVNDVLINNGKTVMDFNGNDYERRTPSG